MALVTRIASDQLREPDAWRRMLDRAFDGGFRDADWEHARGGWHFLVERGGVPIAHAAVVERTLVLRVGEVLTAYVEAVATHPDHRHQGHGTTLMEAVGRFIRAGYRLGGLSAGIPSFYEPLGWEVWRGLTYVVEDDGWTRTPDDDGTAMVLRTPTSPRFETSGRIACHWRPGEVW